MFGMPSMYSAFLGSFASSRHASQCNAMGVVNEAVKDAIGQCGVANLLMPPGHWQLRS